MAEAIMSKRRPKLEKQHNVNARSPTSVLASPSRPIFRSSSYTAGRSKLTTRSARKPGTPQSVAIKSTTLGATDMTCTHTSPTIFCASLWHRGLHIHGDQAKNAWRCQHTPCRLSVWFNGGVVISKKMQHVRITHRLFTPSM